MKVDIYICRAETAMLLSQHVNAQLAQGYELHGYVFAIPNHGVAQAVIKWEEEEEDPYEPGI